MAEPGAVWRAVARRTNGADYAHRYAAHFDALAASGQDVHGEAAYVAALVAPPARVLDAGCGTGRVAARLAGLGYRVAGVDVDETMTAVARERHPELAWHTADLAGLALGEVFDVVVLAGNVVPFLDVEELPAAAGRLAAHLAGAGALVAGFGLDRSHLPPGAPVLPLAAYDAACEAAGLELAVRHGGWAGEPFEEAGGYAVSVHRPARTVGAGR